MEARTSRHAKIYFICYTACYILTSIRSDHSLLKLTLKLEDEEKRGRGIWKLKY